MVAICGAVNVGAAFPRVEDLAIASGLESQSV